SAYVITASAITSGPLGTALLTLGDNTTLRSSSSTGQLILNNVSASGNITLGASATQTGTLAFTDTAGANTVTAPTFTLTGNTSLTTLVDVTIKDRIAGAFSLTKAGGSTLSFTGGVSNTYTGKTLVNSGTLILNKTAGTNAIASTGATGA